MLKMGRHPYNYIPLLAGYKKKYCESTIVCGIQFSLVFVGRQNHKIWFQMKLRFPYVHMENLKATNSRIHKLVFLS